MGKYVRLEYKGENTILKRCSLYSTIVSTAMPTIGSEFNQMSIVAWVATAYILTFDAFRMYLLAFYVQIIQ
jgi:hypothetical protein